MTRLRAGNYGRQSAGNATSVADQHRSNDGAISQQGWDETVRYADLVSASRFGTKARDDWPKLVADVDGGRVDVVVMWDLSRGDRTVATWAGFVDLCRDRGVLIHATSHGRTYDPRVPRDWRTLMDDGVEAGYDSEQKSLVVRRGHAGNAAAGKPHGVAGYGYSRVYDPHDRKKFRNVPNEDAEVVREIIGRCAREEPLKHIVDDLNARGIPSPRGGLWTSRVVKQFATHPRYVGLRRHKENLHPAQWEPLVDRRLYERAVAVLTAPGRKAAAPASRKYLMSYIALAHCGEALSVDPGTSTGRSPRYRCNADGCTSVGAVPMDDLVTRLILTRLARPDARRLFMPPDGQTAEIEAEIAALEARLAEARASFASPFGISAAALAALEHAVQPQLDAARRRQRELSTNAAGLELLGDGPFTAEVGEPRWAGLPLAAQRSVVKSLFTEIKVGPPLRALTRWSTDQQRRLAVVERTTVVWR